MKPHYKCSQKDLYSALRIVWTSYLLYWALFKNYKDFYSEAYAATALDEIKAAEDLHEHDINLSDSGEIGHEMGLLADTVIWDYLKTEGYIDSAYKDKIDREKNYIQAGYNYYLKGIKEDWSSIVELGNVNRKYVMDNATKLEENNNMPHDFIASVELNQIAFDAKHILFMTSKNVSVETAAKVKANNDCYDFGREMMNDAQRIFRLEQEKANLFVWERILKLVSSKQAGLEGYIKDKATKVMLPGVVVELQLEGEPKFEVTTNAEGKYSAKGIKAGTYTYKITCVGKKTITGVKEVKTGTVSRLNFEMEDL